MAIEDFLCEKFGCDNFIVHSAHEYHCNQRNKAGILRANVSTYFAKDRVEQFYSYLRTEQVSIFDGSVEVTVDEGITTPAPHSGSSMVYVYVVVIILFCGIVIVVMTTSTVLGIRKFRKKSLKCMPDDNRQRSSARGVLRPQNCDIKDCNLSRSPVSPIPLSSPVLNCSPNHTHTHTPHNIDIPPHSSSNTFHNSNSDYPEGELFHYVIR